MEAVRILLTILSVLFILDFYIIFTAAYSSRDMQRSAKSKMLSAARAQKLFMILIPMITAIVIFLISTVTGDYVIVCGAAAGILAVLRSTCMTTSPEEQPICKMYCVCTCLVVYEWVLEYTLNRIIKNIKTALSVLVTKMYRTVTAEKYEFDFDKIAINGNIEVKNE